MGEKMKNLGNRTALEIGTVITLQAMISLLLFSKPKYTAIALLIIGVVPVVFATLFAGGFISGGKNGDNCYVEEDSREKRRILIQLFLLGLPCFVSSFAIYFFAR